MIKASHETFRTGKVVSLWLGHFTEEEEIDEYLGQPFANDFGFEINPSDGPEYDFAEEAKEIGVLLDGFSRSDSFLQEATQLAKAQGWLVANSALVFYNFHYKPEFIANVSAPFTFIGVVSYGGFT